RPQADELAAPGRCLEAQLFVMRKLLLKAFFALVHRCPVAPRDGRQSRRAMIYETAPCISIARIASSTCAAIALRASTAVAIARLSQEFGLLPSGRARPGRSATAAPVSPSSPGCSVATSYLELEGVSGNRQTYLSVPTLLRESQKRES